MSLSDSNKVKKNVSSVIPWQQVCKMLDKVQEGHRDKKKEMLLRFINQYKELLAKNASSTDSFFPVMRILLPGLDRDRGAYGIKERKLAELYIRILGLKKLGEDAQKLLNFRKPKSGGMEAGDFADVAFHVLKNRCPAKGTLSLRDVDDYLTTIADSHASKKHDEVEKSLLQMLVTMTANEQKWLIRVLLKDMHLGIGQNTIFSTWHPDAKDYYDVNNSLVKVCSDLRDPSVRLHEIEISLFSPFRPMLAKRINLDIVESQMKNKTYFVETKYDGERSQIHKKGNQYKYFSRNGFDFSSNFGTDPSNGLFTPHLHNLFPSHVQDAILDGEVIGWSQKYKTFVTKGENMDVKNLKEYGDWQVCFCAFDILYLNGKVLTNIPLYKRLEELKRSLLPLEGRVVITTHSEVTTKEEVLKALNTAIDNREEGVVLKDPSSAYQPASRKAEWIKVKPDYVDSCVPELDLLIIGGYYGKGRRRGIISHFLLAVAETSPETNVRPNVVHSFCRVGSGYTTAELEDLIARLSKHITQKRPHNILIGKEKPDIWFTPEKSCVVQVKGAEIVKSDLYKTGNTLRFPRVEKIRSDKSWFEVLTTEELVELSLESRGKLANKYFINEENSESPRKKIARQSRQPSLPDFFRPADVSHVVKKADLFSGKEFCIITGNEDVSKHQLETLVIEHGGTFTQHPGRKTYCIVCDKMSIRVQNFINSGLYNVVKPNWVLECIETRRLLTWSPLQVFHLLPENVKKMEDEFDKFGDSFYEATNLQKLKAVMDGMTDKTSWKECTPDEEYEIDILTTDPVDIRNLFRRVKAFFPAGSWEGLSQNVAQLLLKMHGGTVCSSPTDDITHIVICGSDIAAICPSEYPGKHIVTDKWIINSVKEEKILSDRNIF